MAIARSVDRGGTDCSEDNRSRSPSCAAWCRCWTATTCRRSGSPCRRWSRPRRCAGRQHPGFRLVERQHHGRRHALGPVADRYSDASPRCWSRSRCSHLLNSLVPCALARRAGGVALLHRHRPGGAMRRHGGADLGLRPRPLAHLGTVMFMFTGNTIGGGFFANQIAPHDPAALELARHLPWWAGSCSWRCCWCSFVALPEVAAVPGYMVRQPPETQKTIRSPACSQDGLATSTPAAMGDLPDQPPEHVPDQLLAADRAQPRGGTTPADSAFAASIYSARAGSFPRFCWDR